MLGVYFSLHGFTGQVSIFELFSAIKGNLQKMFGEYTSRPSWSLHLELKIIILCQGNLIFKRAKKLFVLLGF